MNTNEALRATSAAVVGARHLRAARNGQDAAATWLGEAAGAIVVCDGCGAGASSEVGARLGARLVIAALARRLAAGARPEDPSLWASVRIEVAGVLSGLADAMLAEATPGARDQLVHDHLLFTIVAAAVAGDEAAVWAIGDGAFAIDGRVRELGPFADNQPPYLAYDLLGMPQVAHLEVATGAATIVVATDGVAELGADLGISARDDVERFLAHPDALRRQLVLHARARERVDWEARRIARSPAALQDDGAIAILRRSVAS